MDYEQILLKDPLYTEYLLDNIDRMDLLNLLFYLNDNNAFNRLKTIDSYCVICKKDTPFTSQDINPTDKQEFSDLLTRAGMYSGSPGGISKVTLNDELEKKCFFIRRFNCPRKPFDSSHSQIFFFRVIGTTFIKVGQHPSLASLSIEGLKKYRKHNNEIYSELNRAVGLSTHGIGIGAYTYLRRIIEKHILIPKIKELIDEGKINKEQLLKLDFKEKIKLAKDKLPNFLVENGKIYSILSKGIHELEEEECKEYFPILRTAIEIVLDEQMEQIEKKKKKKLISDQLNKIR